jgi:hypothetical protein
MDHNDTALWGNSYPLLDKRPNIEFGINQTQQNPYRSSIQELKGFSQQAQTTDNLVEK